MSEAPTPVLILDGQENALSMARSFGRRGVPVAVAAGRHCAALRSRYCRWRYATPEGRKPADYWRERLIDDPPAALRGAVLLCGSDAAIEFVAQAHAELSAIYRLDDHDPALHLAMLDKQRTLELGRAAGVGTPRWWQVDTAADLDSLPADIPYPCLIKPLHSHRFQQVFRKKYWLVEDAQQLRVYGQRTLDAELGFMICEQIPGPDTALSSYYTYIDDSGRKLFEFTKRVERRYPYNSGGGTCHATQWLPETAEAGRRFFEGIGFRGLGNVEFKRDPRDGELKLIECNPRYTAAQELVVQAGIDMAWIVYRHLLGHAEPAPSSYREGLRLWYPGRDIWACRELARRGQQALRTWLRTLLRPIVLPYFRLGDPMPGIPMSKTELRARYGP